MIMSVNFAIGMARALQKEDRIFNYFVSCFLNVYFPIAAPSFQKVLQNRTINYFTIGVVGSLTAGNCRDSPTLRQDRTCAFPGLGDHLHKIQTSDCFLISLKPSVQLPKDRGKETVSFLLWSQFPNGLPGSSPPLPQNQKLLLTHLENQTNPKILQELRKLLYTSCMES